MRAVALATGLGRPGRPFFRTTRRLFGPAISCSSTTPGSWPIYAFFIVAHESREILHVNVTRVPTDAWVAQQLREATPYDQTPRFLIRDNDGKFGSDFATAADGASIDVVAIPPKSPNLNASVSDFSAPCDASASITS